MDKQKIEKVINKLENQASPQDKDVDKRYNSYIKTAEIYKQTLLIMKGAVKHE